MSEQHDEAPALAGVELDGVAFPVTPVFDDLVRQFGEDPRGARVPTWDEVGYVGGRRARRGDEAGAGAGRV